MERYFNIGGPCSAADHYRLPAMARLPQVVSLVSKKRYFVVTDTDAKQVMFPLRQKLPLLRPMGN